MDKLLKNKGYIFILIILVAFLGVFYFFLQMNNEIKEKNEDAPVLTNDLKVKSLSNKNTYMSITNNINTFINCINEGNSDKLSYYLNDKLKGSELEIITDYRCDEFVIDSMSYIDNSDNFVAFIELTLYYEGKDSKKIYLIDKIDFYNNSYSFYIGEQDEYQKEQKNIIKNIEKKFEIDLNDYNSFKMTVVDDINMCAYYFSTYKKLVNYSIEEAYRKLSSNNRNKTREEFRDYISENLESINNAYIVKTNGEYINGAGSNMIYYCEDNNGKLYGFEESGLDKYEITFEY